MKPVDVNHIMQKETRAWGAIEHMFGVGMAETVWGGGNRVSSGLPTHQILWLIKEKIEECTKPQ